MKVCLVNNLYKPYNRGGAEEYLDKLFEGFKKRGDKVFVISSRPFSKSKKEEETNYYLKSFYCNLNRIPTVFKIFWHIFNIFNIFKYFSVKKIIIRENPDLIITNNLLGLGFLLPSLFNHLKIKHIHILHDIQLLHPSGLMFLGKEEKIESVLAIIYQKINRYLFREVKFIISPSNWLLDLHKKKGFFRKSKSRRVFNPIDTNTLKGNKNNNKIKKFLYVGQIEEHKGVISLFETMHSMLKIADIEFSVIGGGSLEKSLSDKYSNSIKFLGRKSKQSVYSEMLSSDCLLVSSFCYENSPTVIYEAALMNLNFIYPNFGGVREIGKYFEGISYNPARKESLVSTIELCINKENISKNLKKKVLDLNTFKYIENLLNIL